MNPTASPSPAQEINRLHQEVVRRTDYSRKFLHAGLAAAWQAGQLLLAEQNRVYRTMGAAWGFWLEQNFKGSRRTAQNYMRLAESVADVSEFQGLSLRQVYLRLGIATEPKSRTDSPHVEKLPAHIRLANRLLETLNTRDKTPQANPELFRQDLRALYERLRRLFEPSPSENLNAPALSKKNQP